MRRIPCVSMTACATNRFTPPRARALRSCPPLGPCAPAPRAGAVMCCSCACFGVGRSCDTTWHCRDMIPHHTTPHGRAACKTACRRALGCYRRIRPSRRRQRRREKRRGGKGEPSWAWKGLRAIVCIALYGFGGLLLVVWVRFVSFSWLGVRLWQVGDCRLCKYVCVWKASFEASKPKKNRFSSYSIVVHLLKSGLLRDVLY